MMQKPETERLVKHACRTLLKRGDPKAMALFGFKDDTKTKVRELRLALVCLPIGGMLEFSFDLTADADVVRIEYAIDYLKARGHHNRKVFKISERSVRGSEIISRRHRVHDLTTRVHHPGKHHLHIVINGVVKASTMFELTR